MRVWDVNPGYLNRQSLLGEHSEIHGLLSIIENGQKGFANHPETLRWKAPPALEALKRRHDLVVSEMLLRGYQHRSPVTPLGSPEWPAKFVDPPGRQYGILGEKYLDREPGRIPLPKHQQQLWAQHKYSVLARDPELYSHIGSELAKPESAIPFDELSSDLVDILRERPPEGRLMNAAQHMWGHVSQLALPADSSKLNDPAALMVTVRELALKHHVAYLLESTALSDLHSWVQDAASLGSKK